MRRVLSSLLALAGVASTVTAPFLTWYADRPGERIRAQDLVHGATGMDADLLASLFLPLCFAAFVALIAVVMRSRLLMTVGGLLVLATASLWLARQSDTAAGLAAALVGPGLGVAVGGGALLLIAGAVAGPRPARHSSPPGGDPGRRNGHHLPVNRISDHPLLRPNPAPHE